MQQEEKEEEAGQVDSGRLRALTHTELASELHTYTLRKAPVRTIDDKFGRNTPTDSGCLAISLLVSPLGSAKSISDDDTQHATNISLLLFCMFTFKSNFQLLYITKK